MTAPPVERIVRVLVPELAADWSRTTPDEREEAAREIAGDIVAALTPPGRALPPEPSDGGKRAAEDAYDGATRDPWGDALRAAYAVDAARPANTEICCPHGRPLTLAGCNDCRREAYARADAARATPGTREGETL